MNLLKPQNNQKKIQDPSLSQNVSVSGKKKGFFEMLFSKEGGKKEEKKNTIPKWVQDTIPYANAYSDGIFVDKDGVYSRTYPLLDVNFDIESIETQSEIYLAYQDIFNLFSPDVSIQINIINQNLQREKFHKMILFEHKDDGMDHYRDEMNEMLISKEDIGENSIVQKKYLTIGVKADNIDDARTKLNIHDKNLKLAIKKINHDEPEALTVMERLEMLYNFYNSGKESDFLLSYMPEDGDVNSFDITKLPEMGLSTKDIIAPDYFEFARDKMLIGDKYAQALYVKDYPTILSSDFLTSLNTVLCTMVTSVFFEIVDKEIALKKTMNLQTNTNAEIITAQKRALKSGYDPELIPQRLKNARDSVEEFRDQIQNNNQKLIKTTILIVHVADSLEELARQEEQIISLGRSKMFTIQPLKEQQEIALNSVLPFARNEVAVFKSLITQSVAMLMPFKLQEMLERNGIYYGLNAITQKMIMMNRKGKNYLNYNALFLGTSGSGKSFLAKKEMVSIFLRTNDDIIILDPEDEYSPIVSSLGGSVINLTAGCDTYINPFDVNLAIKEDGVDPFVEKISYIASICEVAAGGRRGLTQSQYSVLDRCLQHVYAKFKETQDPKDTPTMKDFYEDLLKQSDPEAISIARPLEQFAIGSLTLFAHQTNVQLDNRLTSYNTKNLTNPALKEVALVACLNDIWNRILDNKQKGKFTWVYIDEFHLFLRADNIADFLKNMWKRARKWNGALTGITQNISDLLKSQASETIFANSNCTIMLNQAPGDRASLARQKDISERCQQFITNANAGSGLMHTGKSIIPFVDEFPDNTDLYKLITTRAVDDAQPVRRKEEDQKHHKKDQNERLPDFVRVAMEKQKKEEEEKRKREEEAERERLRMEEEQERIRQEEERLRQEEEEKQKEAEELERLRLEEEEKKKQEERKREEEALAELLQNPENLKFLKEMIAKQEYFKSDGVSGLK